MFLVKGHKHSGLKDKVRKAYKHQKMIRVLTISFNGDGKHYPICQRKSPETQEIVDIRLIKEEQNTRKFECCLPDDEIRNESVQDDFFTTFDDFDHEKNSYV